MDVQKLPVADSPATDPLEAIFATYYQINGFITSSNKWFWVFKDGNQKRGYQDIDVLAMSGSETIIVSVTANLDDKVRFDRSGQIKVEMLNKLIAYYDRSEIYLRSVPEYKWLCTSGRSIRRILAYGNGGNLSARLMEYLKPHQIELLASSLAIQEIKRAVSSQTDHGLKTNNQLIKLIQYIPNA